MAVCLSAGKLDLGLGDAELFGKEGDQRFIGLSLFRNSIKPDLQLLAFPAGDLVARGFGHHFDAEDKPLACCFDRQRMHKNDFSALKYKNCYNELIL